MADLGSTIDRKLYHDLSCYTLAHRSPQFIHQHVVDAFAAQNATSTTRPITLAFALLGLYLYVEKGYSGREIQRVHMDFARQKRPWPFFDAPEDLRQLTVRDVMRAPAGPDRDRMIDTWATCVWNGWSGSHGRVAALARELARSDARCR